MSRKAGQLLWRRLRVSIASGVLAANLDTGIIEPSSAYEPNSVNEPILNGSQVPAVPSRCQVIPELPSASWTGISHGEPFVDPTTGTVKVAFSNTGLNGQTFNVLIWDPHSRIGPGEAELYNQGEG